MDLGGNKGGGFKFSSSRIFIYGLFAFSIVYASQCIYQLDASERAVILRFGKFYEEQEEGLNFRLAGIDERYIENVTLTRRYTQTNSMLTKDENIVDVTVSAQYKIANLKDFVLNVKDPEGSLRNAIESALRHVVGDNTFDQTLTVGRENIAQEVQARLQSYLDIYKTGLIVQQEILKKLTLLQLLKTPLMMLLPLERIKKDCRTKQKGTLFLLFQKLEVKLKRELERQKHTKRQ